MILALITFITGITISAVAIYYSVIGLAAIFAAAVIPIMIMGGILEVSKLVAAWWLKWNWHRAPLALKTYLTGAVVVLMLITSMGIFGFLSRAHIEQTHSSIQSVAQVERIEAEIDRQESMVRRVETRLLQLETGGTSVNQNIQSQIDTEQSRIDSALARIQPAIDEQQRIIDQQTNIYTEQLDSINRELLILQQYINDNEVSKAQAMVGTRADGQWGPNTAEAVRVWREQQNQQRNEIISSINQINLNPVVQAARAEIQRLRLTVEQQVEQSNELINRLRQQLGNTDSDDLDSQITEQREILSQAFAEIDRLVAEKFNIESQVRKLEAEVGPIKYIAEFVYGESADEHMLEKAVTWLIIIIIFVFDPLAVLLLLASQLSFRWALDEKAAASNDHQTKIKITDSKAEYNNDIESQDTTETTPTAGYSYVAKPCVWKSGLQPYITIRSELVDEQPEIVSEPDIFTEPSVIDEVDITSTEEFSESNSEPLTQKESSDLHHDLVKRLHPEEPKPVLKLSGSRLQVSNDTPIDTKPETDITAKADNVESNNPLPRADFGSSFPANPSRGDMFLRVDVLPNRLYKWNDYKWIEVSKTSTDQFIYNRQYIEHLVKKIEAGQYDIDLLTNGEQEQIIRYLHEERK